MERGTKVEERCIRCLLDKYLERIPSGASQEKVLAYQERVRSIVEEVSSRKGGSAPEAASRIDAFYQDWFSVAPFSYENIKKHYNALLLSREDQLREEILGAKDPLYRAVCLAMMGNYIDFAALSDVTEERLWELLGEAGDLEISQETFGLFAQEVRKARKAVYVTDNCGEVVLDKLLMEEMKRENPELSFTCIVRGKPVHNDVTMEDAIQVGLSSVARVIPNGTGMNGTVLPELSQEAREELLSADFVVSKGQANHESLLGSGLNIFYLFLCKCELFVERYGCPLFTGVMVRERSLAL